MDAAAVGVTEKEDCEESIHEQDIFDGVVLFLPAITVRLFSSVLGADDASFRPVMGKMGDAGAAAGTATRLSDSIREIWGVKKYGGASPLTKALACLTYCRPQCVDETMFVERVI
jgi:hypothetical protein